MNNAPLLGGELGVVLCEVLLKLEPIGHLDRLTLVLETAKAAKFGGTVTEALGRAQPVPPEITGLLALPQHVETIADDEAPLRALIEAGALRA